MTHEQAMDELKERLELIARSNGATDAQVRAAMVAAMVDGADRLTVRRMADAVGLHLLKG